MSVKYFFDFIFVSVLEIVGLFENFSRDQKTLCHLCAGSMSPRLRTTAQDTNLVLVKLLSMTWDLINLLR